MWLIYVYLRIALFFGLKDHVYNLSGGWVSSANMKMPRRLNAAWMIQEALIKQHGYFECPFCCWATKTQDEHIKKGEGYCYEQSCGNPGIPWDQESDPQLAYEKMPDRLRRQ